MFFPGGRREVTSLQDSGSSESYRSQEVPFQGAHAVNSGRGQEPTFSRAFTEGREIQECSFWESSPKLDGPLREAPTFESPTPCRELQYTDYLTKLKLGRVISLVCHLCLIFGSRLPRDSHTTHSSIDTPKNRQTKKSSLLLKVDGRSQF